jgi:cysteinyl-tRNA synthetase
LFALVSPKQPTRPCHPQTQLAFKFVGEAGAQALQAAGSAAVAGRTALQAALITSLLDDLNTPAALSELSAPLKAINDLLTTKAGRKQPDRCAHALH